MDNMSMEAALKRLKEEKLDWLQNQPQGFMANPYRDVYGDFNLMKWECFVPGKDGTIWQGARYKLKMVFNQCYPLLPPTCLFHTLLYHPNISPVGRLYMSLLDFDEWNINVTIKDILIRIQEVLDKPEMNYPVRAKAAWNYKYNYPLYAERVKVQVRRLKFEDAALWLNV